MQECSEDFNFVLLFVSFQIGIVDLASLLEVHPTTPAASVLIVGLRGDSFRLGSLRASNPIHEVIVGGRGIIFICGGRKGGLAEYIMDISLLLGKWKSRDKLSATIFDMPGMCCE